MNRLLGVCLVVLAATGAQQRQAGIHVELPFARSAAPASGSDEAGALVSTITEDGRVYVGVTPVGPADFNRVLSSEKGKTLYLKGDARTAYGNVLGVLETLPAAGFGKVSVLTAQQESPEPGKLLSPKALEVLLGARAPAGAKSAIELLQSEQGRPAVKIDNERVPWASLAGALRGALSAEKAAVVHAEAAVPFGEVVEVIDACRSTGATVVLQTPAP